MFLATALANNQMQRSEKSHLASLIMQASTENAELIAILKEKQNNLGERFENLEPYFKIVALDAVFTDPLLTAHCEDVAKKLIEPLTQLRVSSYFAGVTAYTDMGAFRKDIKAHIANLEKSNKLLNNCYTALTGES